MSTSPDTFLAGVVSRKAAAELVAALPAGEVVLAGSAPADVFLVKGVASPADLSQGTALAGADGEAARKALAALGWDVSVFALCVRQGEQALESESLALAMEAVDPDLVVALDDVAAAAVAEALGIASLHFGDPVRVAGRLVLAVDGLEASLSDDARKRRVWAQLKNVQRD